LIQLGRNGLIACRFHFTIILPSSLPSHDWHIHAQLSHTLTAELEGTADPGNVLSSVFKSTSATTSRRGSSLSRANPPLRSRSPSPLVSRSPSPLGFQSAMGVVPISGAISGGELSTTRQDDWMPKVPSYTESQGLDQPGNDKIWVRGTQSKSRAIMVMHNPSRTNSFSDLDLQQRDFAQGLGIYEVRIFTDVVSCSFRISIPRYGKQS